jgi:hypothetical protein
MNTPVTPDIVLDKVNEEDEELEDELEDELSELANFKKITIGRPNKPRIPTIQDPSGNENNELKVVNLNEKVEIVKNEDHEAQNLKVMEARAAKKISEVKRSRGGRFTRKASEESTSDDDYGDMIGFAPRVERFLSIVEIPPEILMYTQQLANQQTKKAADRPKNEAVEQSATTDTNNNTTKQKSSRFPNLKPPYGRVNNAKKAKAKTAPNKADEDKEMIRHYRNGAGLSQAAKREIIRDIIRNFDMKKYLSEFKESSVVEITYDRRLDHKKVSFAPTLKFLEIED